MANDADLKDRLSFAIFWAMWKRQVSAPKLATAVGKSPDTIRRWRDGETAPSVLDVGPLARALGVRAAYFTNPPEVPSYPFEDYTDDDLVAAAVSSGAAEGGRRRNSRARQPLDTPPESAVRPVRGARAGRE